MEDKFITEKNNDLLTYPPCPEKPSESDCCRSGCSTCVFDIYHKQLLVWEQEVEKIKSQNKLENAHTPINNKTVVLCQERFLPFHLLSVQQHTDDTFLYTFQAVKEVSVQQPEYIQIQQPLQFKQGQYLIMRCSLQSSEGGITRAYTPISGIKSSSLGRFKVLIKLYKEGKMSQYLKTLNQWDIVFWKGPYGNFKYIPNSYQYMLMLCAGTGIAPMFSIARALLKNEDDETIVHMFFACRGYGDILLRQKLQKLAGYWNFSVEIFLSCAQDHELEHQILYRENIRKHKINREIVTKELSGKDSNRILVLICGKKLFNKDMMTYVKDVGISDSNIYVF